METFDFSGWATRNDLPCSDGRTIRKDAFKHHDGKTVPLVWNHQHANPEDILGHALLENREEGVYAYCSFNDGDSAQAVKKLVQHGDVKSLSIYANQLKQTGGNVLHGSIREVSLVLAGANPGAYIESIMSHGDDQEEALIINYDVNILLHSADSGPAPKKEGEKQMPDTNKPSSADKTVSEVFDTMNEEQKTVVYAMIAQALEDGSASHSDTSAEEEETMKHSEEGEGEENMKHNVFDDSKTEKNADTLSHSDMKAIIADARKCGSLRDSVLEHGITNIDYLFPEAQNVNNTPDFIKRETGWVNKVMNSAKHSPFSRIKSTHADITADEARAKGYIKGKKKVDEVFTLLKRTTTPTTIYKKQKLDRDDIIDIVDFDVVAWMKAEMRMMLDEEIARAMLIGDGRLGSSDDKINELNIRPIWTDDDLYCVKTLITSAAADSADKRAKAFIRGILKDRKNYKGSGDPTLFTTEDTLTDCLLMEDTTGRMIYDSVAKLAMVLRVKEIVTVPVMEGRTRTDEDGKTRILKGLLVNLADYNLGADKGGAVNLFDDFDIDYNANKYLIETRCSGALTVPYSAMAIEEIVEEEAAG